MIKSVIFDMDGVLIDARDWHKDALNGALQLFGLNISDQDHYLKFDGLPTRHKLDILSEQYFIPTELRPIINRIKQQITLRIAAERCFPSVRHLTTISYLKEKGFLIGCATNSVRGTAEAMLDFAGVLEMLDQLITNEDVVNAKPSPDIYLLTASKLGVLPSECLVVEDNVNGIRAAESAGCHVVRVNSPEETNLPLILASLNRLSA